MTDDKYGKDLMRRAVGDAFVANVKIDYGGILRNENIIPRIDGRVGESIAVEIQAGWSKAARGAILDLICSERYPSKLLIVIDPPNSGGYATRIRGHCERILGRFLPNEQFRVVLLHGNHSRPRWDDDLLIIRGALRELGWPADRSAAIS